MVFKQFYLINLTVLSCRGGECMLSCKVREVSVQFEISGAVNALT
jgi:hypothetical protein